MMLKFHNMSIVDSIHIGVRVTDPYGVYLYNQEITPLCYGSRSRIISYIHMLTNDCNLIIRTNSYSISAVHHVYTITVPRRIHR